jgi:hypothetical protein
LKHDTTVARALCRAPFALLSWVLADLTPDDLLGANCRALVIAALMDVLRAVRAASKSNKAAEIRATLDGMADRAKSAFEALGQDPLALSEDPMPPPTAVIEGSTVARVVFALAHELGLLGMRDTHLLPALLDRNLTDRVAARASATNVSIASAPTEPTTEPSAKRGSKRKG